MIDVGVAAIEKPALVLVTVGVTWVVCVWPLRAQAKGNACGLLTVQKSLRLLHSPFRETF